MMEKSNTSKHSENDKLSRANEAKDQVNSNHPNEKTESKKEAGKVTKLQIITKKRRTTKSIVNSDTRSEFLKNFEASFGNISIACIKTGISRQTYYRWMKSKTKFNVKFQDEIKKIQPLELLLDVAEGMLLEKIKAGDTAAAIYVLKTKGRSRGYCEKTNDIKHQLTLRAVARLEKIIGRALEEDPDYKPELKRFAQIAADDFGVKAEDIEREFLKRNPQGF